MPNMTHPDILKTERFGTLLTEPCVVHCNRCRGQINTLYNDHYVDKYGNVFCGVECAMEKHGIYEVEV